MRGHSDLFQCLASPTHSQRNWHKLKLFLRSLLPPNPLKWRAREEIRHILIVTARCSQPRMLTADADGNFVWRENEKWFEKFSPEMDALMTLL